MRLFAVIVALTMILSGCDKPSTKAYGTLERERVIHLATQSELIVDLPVAVGSRVNEGDLIVVLDRRGQQASVDAAHAEMQRAIANLQKLRNGARVEELASAQAQVREAQSRVTETETNFQRTRDLVERDMASVAMLDRATANRDAAVAQYQQAEEALRELTNGTRPEDLMIAEAELSRAEAMLRLEEKKLGELAITSSRTGILETLPWNLGERVASGSPVAVVLAGAAPFARIYLPEPYRVHVRSGMSLKLTVDGIDSSIDGEVRWVSDDASFTPYFALSPDDRSRLVYVLEVQLDEQYAELPSGLPVQIDLSQLNRAP